MSFLGNLSNFDHKTGEWQIFYSKLNQFFVVNKVTEVNYKRALLFTHLTDETYRLVRNLAHPKDVETLGFEELVTLLNGHFKKKQCTYADKARFYAATRGPGEQLGDWAARLRGLATFCDFGAALEANLADRFVLGLGSGPERDKLFENKANLTLASALEIAEKAAVAREARTEMATRIKEEPVFYAVKASGSGRGGWGKARRGGGGGAPPVGSDQRQQEDPRCDVCGMKSHGGGDCRYKRYRCQKCGVIGHLKKVCKNKSSRVNCIASELEENLLEESDQCCEECQNFNLRYVSNKPIVLDLILDGKNISMELDSGSGVCVISEKLYAQMFAEYKLNACKMRMCMYNGHKVSPLGFFTIQATYNGMTKEINIFVLSNGGPPLLGRDFMSAFNLVLTANINRISDDNDVHNLLEQYPNIWRDELGSFNKFKVNLHLKENAFPKFFKPRSVPFALKDKVDEELDRLVKLGILVPINYSKYATPIVPVLKDNGKVRIAGDFSVTLNKDLVVDKYPLPRIEEVFAKLGGGEHYSKIDLKNAYNQFVLEDSSQELTTINTSRGLFKYTRLVYGLANAPAIFQKSMETLLSGIDGVSCWLDDICVTGPNKSSHLKRLKEVLSRLNEAGLRLQKEKCEFFKTSITYLGYVISKDGLQTCPNKVQAILNAPEPTNVTEVKRFLGVVNYYRNFIPNASAIMSPLHELLRAGAEWEWGERQRRAVSAVRRELASERVLAHFEPSAQLVLSVDAGPGGLGALLAQRTRDGRERPLAFASRSLTSSEHCLHLQLYRDPKDRFKKGQTKASLSLQQFLGFESGFTLDKESNTIAIICQDVIVVLAFETRERLIAWQVKVGGQLGTSKEWLVMIGGGSRKLPAGPARLHLQGRRFALASGVPPRLLGLWELAHLRRYGVVEGRFCFEGGSHCGKGEGLHVLITDQAQDIADGFDAAAHGHPRAPASRKSGGADRNRPDTRLSDFNAGDQSIPDTGLYEENFFGEDCGGVSPFWPSDERRGFDENDCKGCEERGTRPPWSGADHVTLERCSNCVTKLGTMTRSSTVALTPGTHFNPAWTMEAVPESSSDNSSNSTEYLTPRAIKKSLEASQCDWAPQRPPKPPRLDEKKPPAPLPASVCACSNDRNYAANAKNPKVGPYENYDVPKATHVEVESTNIYYDTPKRIKQALKEDLFQVTKNSAPGNLVLKKNCGCILKFGSKKKPVIVECDDNIQPVECPCQKVTNWANNLISLPYCKRSVNYDKVNTEVLTSQKSEDMALYATVDVTRKTNRQSSINEKECLHSNSNEPPFMNYENLDPKGDNEFEDPYANYENLEFALSLEYYENAKDLLKKAGVTQKELDALSANVDFAEIALPAKPKNCAKCGHSAKHQIMKKNKSDEYLLMEPAKETNRDLCRTTGPNPGYTPMSPNPNWSQSLRHPLQKLHKVDIEKSHSIPTLNGTASRAQSFDVSTSSNNNTEAIQKRSCSVDSARLLEDLKEFDSSIGSHATSSSLETLRNLAIENRRTLSPCDNERDCCDHDCCKSSDSENKTSEGSCSKDMPHLRNKHMDNAQIKRSSSVPCKSGGNRDSSSSNDSGVSSCSMKQGPEYNEFEMPLTSGHSRHQYMAHRRMRGNATGCIHSSLPRKSKSSDLLRDMTMQIHKANVPAKSSSAEAEVPVLPPKQFKGVMDTHSTSSGTSDMSDYIETLSLTSSHSSSDNPNVRMARQPTMTLRPRSGKEYHNLDPIITSMYKSGKELSNYTNLP